MIAVAPKEAVWSYCDAGVEEGQKRGEMRVHHGTSSPSMTVRATAMGEHVGESSMIMAHRAA